MAEGSGDKEESLSDDHDETISPLTIRDRVRYFIEASLVVVFGFIVVGPEVASAALEGTLMLGR